MLSYSKASWAGKAKIKGEGPTLLTHLDCRGNEKKIDQCHPSRWGVWFCYGMVDAGTKCENISQGGTISNIYIQSL
jgi:hypothetical protein